MSSLSSILVCQAKCVTNANGHTCDWRCEKASALISCGLDAWVCVHSAHKFRRKRATALSLINKTNLKETVHQSIFTWPSSPEKKYSNSIHCIHEKKNQWLKVRVDVNIILAHVASVSVRFRSKERGTRVKDRMKNWAAKTKNPVPLPFFA